MKKFLSVALAILMVCSLSVFSLAAISVDEAKNIALKDSGKTLVNFTNAELDEGVFEIEFSALDGEYDYEIDQDGKILSASADYFDVYTKNEKNITAQEAKEKAIEFYGNSDVRALKVSYDGEDNSYDVEFIDGAKRYDIEVSAYDGDVTGKDYELIAGGNETLASFIALIEEIIIYITNLFKL